MSTLIYFLQANIFLILFFGFYYFFFKKETFHAINRFFLLFGAVFAIVLPFFKSPFLKELPIYPVEAEHIATDYYFVTAAIVEKHLTHQITYLEVCEYIYLVGLGLSILFLLFRISKTILWVKNNRNQLGTAFSFFGKVFIDKTLSGQEFIEKHEEIHVRQLHFADLLFFEILKIVFWFNPVVYFYIKAIVIIHEFLADEVASAIAKDKAQYAQILLSKQFRAENAAVFTQHFFNHSTLKSRIIMLSKNPSKKTALLKFGLLAPTFFVMLAISSFTVVNNPKLEIILTKLEENPSENATRITTDLPKVEIKSDTSKPSLNEEIFATVEHNPEYPGGTTAMYKYLGENIKYPSEAQKANMQGKVYVKFVIKSDGKIDKINIVKSVSPELDNEAIRVVQNMPYWRPAMQNGKAVSVYYNLPINFKLDGGTKELEGEEIVVVGYAKEETSQQSIESKQPTMIGLNREIKTEEQIRIRGNNTNLDKGLIFVNDVEILDKKIDFVSPNSIESVSVLRREEAIKAYGPRAKDGVILIKTKINFIKTDENE
ncbi:TonB family protein [Lacihabitans sp. LS3-19]|uniref:M56 family metallopeptidase n=1 Tax=Lacihabitans sp. LS3-19 TaxID=2487335 RepID=UPI0020CF5AE3|nr:TonB family protein [Lacihabitans sp. LS3-19]MCP9768659.1 TonB family protein [Lacihabitans sp. LS3-19]